MIGKLSKQDRVPDLSAEICHSSKPHSQFSAQITPVMQSEVLQACPGNLCLYDN